MTVPRKADGYVSRTIAGDAIIVPVRGGVGDLESICTLNGVGATIWWAIDGRTSVEALTAEVVRVYEVGSDEAGADVRDFVELLRARGLVVEGATP
jgi:hypothetical protein